jgi:hypothetical protein
MAGSSAATNRDVRVFYDIVTGRPGDVVSSVLRSLSGYTRIDRTRWFKIGITNNPERRWREAYAENYDEMIVLYQSSSITSVSHLEIELVEHNRDLADNIVGGGGGNFGKPPFYLYIVLLH